MVCSEAESSARTWRVGGIDTESGEGRVNQESKTHAEIAPSVDQGEPGSGLGLGAPRGLCRLVQTCPQDDVQGHQPARDGRPVSMHHLV